MEFFFGIPGTIGGALRMNAGANGGETKDVLIEASGIGRDGTKHVFGNADMKFVYRNSGVDPSVIFTPRDFAAPSPTPGAIRARMNDVQSHRETAQPNRKKAGGSTFKNPPGQSAWKLIDAAGMRGHRVGGAQVSEMHCNFLINTGEATARDIETFGKSVRERVKQHSGIELQWEIKRIGVGSITPEAKEAWLSDQVMSRDHKDRGRATNYNAVDRENSLEKVDAHHHFVRRQQQRASRFGRERAGAASGLAGG